MIAKTTTAQNIKLYYAADIFLTNLLLENVTRKQTILYIIFL